MIHICFCFGRLRSGADFPGYGFVGADYNDFLVVFDPAFVLGFIAERNGVYELNLSFVRVYGELLANGAVAGFQSVGLVYVSGCFCFCGNEHYYQRNCPARFKRLAGCGLLSDRGNVCQRLL